MLLLLLHVARLATGATTAAGSTAVTAAEVC